MSEPIGRNRAWALGLLLLGGLLAASAGAAIAQDSEVTASHPAHIHEGTCDDLNPNPLVPLNNVEPRTQEDDDDEDDNDNGEPELRGALDVPQVLFSQTNEVEVSFDTLLDSSHAINVHESEENIQNYIACGNIGGAVVEDQVFIGLQELNGSGYVGIAVITEADDDQVDVRVYLAQGLAEEVEPKPEPDATPEP